VARGEVDEGKDGTRHNYTRQRVMLQASVEGDLQQSVLRVGNIHRLCQQLGPASRCSPQRVRRIALYDENHGVKVGVARGFGNVAGHRRNPRGKVGRGLLGGQLLPHEE